MKLSLGLLNTSLLIVTVLCFVVLVYASRSLKYLFELIDVFPSKHTYTSSVGQNAIASSEHAIIQEKVVQNTTTFESKLADAKESFNEKLTTSQSETLYLPPVRSILLDKSSIYTSPSKNNSLPTDIFFIGNVQAQTRMAVFVCALPTHQSRYNLNYVFYLPLTVLAWHHSNDGQSFAVD
jgi:hypothetical protein